MTKRVFTGFVSYARDDAALVEPFLDLIAPRCRILREIEIDAWWDRRILDGERWEQEIREAIKRSDFGLLCLTPCFLDSPQVRVELRALLSDERLVIPAGMQRVDFDRADPLGVEDLQIFLYRPSRSGRGRWFSECAAENRVRFCDQLVAAIHDRLSA